MRIQCGSLVFLSLLAITDTCVQAQAESPLVRQQPTVVAADELDRKLLAVYERVNSTVVRFEYLDGEVSGGGTGVIVTEEGHILVKYVGPLAAEATLTIQLADGRRVAGLVRGQSQECGVTMLLLDQPGPWPHVDLAQSESVKSGQCLVNLKFPLNDKANVIPRPLLTVSRVTVSSPGWWFLSSEVGKNWDTSGVAFDLNGQCSGIQTFSNASSGQCAYTETKLLYSLINDLIANKNLDQQRLDRKLPNDSETDKPTDELKRTISQEAMETAIAASVRIQDPSGSPMRVSGTIISQEGEIVTCAHHWFMPGTKVTVSLTDGRDLCSVVASIGFPADIGIVKILEPGPFPHVELGKSTDVRVGDSGLLIGYGPVDKNMHQPNARTVSVIDAPRERWSMQLYTNAKPIGGDSGGGLFDADGRLVAIHHGQSDRNEDNTYSMAHGRVELFRKHWDKLHEPFDPVLTPETVQVETQMQQIAQRTRRFVVEILDGNTVVSLGTIASDDGRIWTKASELPNVPFCRLSNGTVLSAVVLKTHRERDLAILKVNATDLPVVQLSQRTDPSVGSLVALIAEKGQAACAYFSHSAVSFPPERGNLGAQLKDTPEGLLVSEVFDFQEVPGITMKLAPLQLRSGDIVQRIDNHPTPNFEAIRQHLYSDNTAPIGLAGDPIHVVVKRDNQTIILRQILRPSTWPRSIGESARRSGIGKVFNLSTDADSVLCGGPILDQQGECLGVVIAWRGRGWANVLPAAMLELE